MPSKLATLAATSACLLLLVCLPARNALAIGDIPPSALKIPAMVPEESVSTHVPSESAPGKGLAVNIIYPARPRYKEGAPVVVVVPGGGADGLTFSMHAAQAGFAELRFAFPGGGRPGLASSGIYDHRGIVSQRALRDVILFAAGKLTDTHGRTIGQITPVKVYNKSVGIVGWDNGGNIALVTLGKYAAELSQVGWIAFYEAPVGAMFVPPNLGGGKDLIINKHYRQGSCATGNCLIDYRKLTWQPKATKNPNAHKRLSEPEIRGLLFFDENKNGHWDESYEYALSYATDVGLDKQIYAPQITRALERLKVFGDEWPATVATLAESEAYYEERDGSLYVKDICEKLPSLMVTVFGTRLDHNQRQSDHPHVALLYNTWLHHRCRFVRLNPCPKYVAQVAVMNASTFPDNKPNGEIDASTMAAHLEPEGIVPDYVLMEASIAELSDRRKLNKLDATLAAPLVEYSNGAEGEESQAAPAKRPADKKGAAKK